MKNLVPFLCFLFSSSILFYLIISINVSRSKDKEEFNSVLKEKIYSGLFFFIFLFNVLLKKTPFMNYFVFLSDYFINFGILFFFQAVIIVISFLFISFKEYRLRWLMARIMASIFLLGIIFLVLGGILVILRNFSVF